MQDKRHLQLVYDGDTRCKKRPSLAPGIVTVHCNHETCLCVAMTQNVESPQTAFRVLLALFDKSACV
jgi:hypothetical protein